jgi:hypothetical protein
VVLVGEVEAVQDVPGSLRILAELHVREAPRPEAHHAVDVRQVCPRENGIADRGEGGPVLEERIERRRAKKRRTDVGRGRELARQLEERVACRGAVLQALLRHREVERVLGCVRTGGVGPEERLERVDGVLPLLLEEGLLAFVPQVVLGAHVLRRDDRRLHGDVEPRLGVRGRGRRLGGAGCEQGEQSERSKPSPRFEPWHPRGHGHGRVTPGDEALFGGNIRETRWST